MRYSIVIKTTPTIYSRTHPTYAAASQQTPTGLGIVGQMRRAIPGHIESPSELDDLVVPEPAGPPR